jgi:PAS domain S-box-containing protein
MEELLKILVVDDDQVDRMAVRRSLQAAGLKVELQEVHDCAAAIALLQAQAFDCVFLDYRLPDADGLTLVQAVRHLGIKVPLVVLTGQGDEQTAVKLIKAGAADYLSKANLSPDSLSRSLLNTIRIHRAEMQAEEARQQLRESEERFRSLVQNSSDIVTIIDTNGTVYYASPSVESILGYQPEDLVGKCAFEALHPEDAPKVLTTIGKLIQKPGMIMPIEFRFRHANGTWIYLEAVGNNRLGDPSIKGVVVNSRDITERKRAESEYQEALVALDQSEARFRRLAESNMIGIIVADLHSNIIEANAAFLKMVGYTREELLAGHLHWSEMTPPEYKPMDERAIEELRTSGVCSPWEKEYIRKDGSRISILIGAALLEGSQETAICFVLEITERKWVEKALQESVRNARQYTTQLRGLTDAALAMNAALSVEGVLEVITEQARTIIGAHQAITSLMLDETGLQTINTISVSDKYAAWRQRDKLLDGTGIYSLVWSMNQPMRMTQAELEAHPVWRSFNEAVDNHPPLRGWLAAPLTGRSGHNIGLIQLSDKYENEFTENDEAMIVQLAQMASVAIENAQLYREAQKVGENLRQAIVILGEQQQQLRTLQHLTNLLNQSLADLPALLQVMVSAVCDAIPEAQFCLIGLYDLQRNCLKLTATAGVSTEKLQRAVSLYTRDGLLGQVFLTGGARKLQGEALNSDQSEDMPASMCAVAIESSQARRLGVLAIGNWEDPLAFDEEDCYLLGGFGEQAAIAINNAQLINTLEEREERLAKQNEILAHQNRELEHQRQQIQLQNLKLIEATQLKSQFLATMSHELRTPINAITGFSQLMLRQRQNPLNSQQVDMVERILNNGKNLLALINDILDLSKIEAGRMELQLEEINLVQLVRITVEELRSLAEEKQLTLQVHAPLENLKIINDSTRLRQILVNLISNAIKFTEVGSVQVLVEEVSPEELAIAVHDTGIGISQKDLQHIFKEFWQVDQTTTRKYQGTGLGLAICQRLINMMSGTITVESKLGEGSTFRIEFPRQASLSTSPSLN